MLRQAAGVCVTGQNRTLEVKWRGNEQPPNLPACLWPLVIWVGAFPNWARSSDGVEDTAGLWDLHDTGLGRGASYSLVQRSAPTQMILIPRCQRTDAWAMFFTSVQAICVRNDGGAVDWPRNVLGVLLTTDILFTMIRWFTVTNSVH